MKIRFVNLRFMTLLVMVATIAASRGFAASSVEIGLASNFSDISDNTLNPFLNSFEHGVLVAIQYHKDALEKKGLKISLRKFNITNNVHELRESAQKMIDSQVVAVIGFHSSAALLLAAPIFKGQQLPVISSSASANRVYELDNNIYSIVFSNRAQALAQAQLAENTLKAKKVHIVTAVDCAYCADLASSFRSALLGKPGVFVTNHQILNESKDLTPIAKAIVNGKADLVFLPNYELPTARIMQRLIDAGYSGPFLGGDGWNTAEGGHLSKVTAETKAKGYFTSHWHAQLPGKVNADFVKLYQSMYQTMPNTDAALAFDSAHFVIKGLLAAKDAKRASLAQQLRKMESVDGATGLIKFSHPAKGNSVQKPVPIFKLDPDAKSPRFFELSAPAK